VDLLDYDYSLDLWSLGCMFAAMVSGKTDQLVILANRPVLMCYMVLTDIPSGPFI